MEPVLLLLLTLSLSLGIIVARERGKRRLAEGQLRDLQEREARRQARLATIDFRETEFQTGGDVPSAWTDKRGSIAEARKVGLLEALAELGMTYDPDAEYNLAAIKFAVGQKRADAQVQKLERCRQMLLSCLDASERRMSVIGQSSAGLREAAGGTEGWCCPACKTPINPAHGHPLVEFLTNLLQQGIDPSGDYARVRKWATNTHGEGWVLCPAGCSHFLLDHGQTGCLAPGVTSAEVLSAIDGACPCRHAGVAEVVVPVPVPKPPSRRRGRGRA